MSLAPPALWSTLLIVLALSPGRVFSAGPNPEHPPLQQYANGLAWEVTGPTVFAQGDAYEVEARIIHDPNYRGRQITLLSGGFAVELRRRPMGGASIHELFKSGTPLVFKLGDRDGGIGARIDLREVFGELSPNLWTARWILRQGKYQVQGHSESSELVAEYTFQIVKTSKNVAAQTYQPTEDVVFDSAEPGSELAGHAFATLTNHTIHAIEFSAYAEGLLQAEPEWEEPITALVEGDRFVPPNSWKTLNYSYCGTGVAQYRLEPGKSVEVHLNSYRGSQFLRFRLPFKIAGQMDNEAHEAISGVVESLPWTYLND